MHSAGFKNYAREWRHLNHDPSAKQRFDFPVQPDSVPTKCHSLASAPLVPR
ncbi:hypothetical protein LB545_20930 [Mesorhizobium sp. BR1-1-6]|nr:MULTISPECIES: M15 family metallopeptidase [unclassified Mesorhizobium]MBZ9896787.1 hypothetical protein [Mesorhizobium sp. BR1-1-6]MBZ9982853.1 hypothetical protein [Mesorhizobium sp. BR-1-1-8]TPL36366.1 M15 family metallopeptidase [Mesorhizobium sp. B2-4-8]TPL66390.1 M15 family metallopeptidase [Mesorhizobium sp. B2-4-1]TPN08493.1 M15 family metallopeptidase [Mesorhizobium sp. B2-1-3]